MNIGRALTFHDVAGKDHHLKSEHSENFEHLLLLLQ